jgi:imidazolonepropionase-like amidohydrolase
MKKNLFYLIAIGLALILFLASTKLGTSVTTDKILAIQGGTLIDGTGAPALPNAVIIIKNEYIISVGSLEDTEIPKGAKVITLKGSAILPGFINAHIHRGYNKRNLKTWAINGVTTDTISVI